MHASAAAERVAHAVTNFTGSTTAFTGALVIVLAWALTGPFFDYSETWQLVINTGTTIVTFLMVFLIQRSQNKDSLAVRQLAQLAKDERDIRTSHSVDEAGRRHAAKARAA
jgi:low affinity Fe/Cu permease